MIVIALLISITWGHTSCTQAGSGTSKITSISVEIRDKIASVFSNVVSAGVEKLMDNVAH